MGHHSPHVASVVLRNNIAFSHLPFVLLHRVLLMPMVAIPTLSRLPLLLALFPFTSDATFSWPRARIPFEDDPRLTADPDMAVALNNARMDLQVRTCVRLVPRRDEKDYAYFSELGPHIECWNMFEPFPPKGRILVNAGTSCLEPMRRPHRPKRVFSECDIEYVNHLYNCPRRRKPSPICPAGRLIMAKPSDLMGRTTTSAGFEENMASTIGVEGNEGEGLGEAAGTSLEGDGHRDRPPENAGGADEETTTIWATSYATSSSATLFPDIDGGEAEGGSSTTEEPSEFGGSSSLEPDEELLTTIDGTTTTTMGLQTESTTTETAENEETTTTNGWEEKEPTSTEGKEMEGSTVGTNEEEVEGTMTTTMKGERGEETMAEGTTTTTSRVEPTTRVTTMDITLAPFIEELATTQRPDEGTPPKMEGSTTTDQPWTTSPSSTWSGAGGLFSSTTLASLATIGHWTTTRGDEGAKEGDGGPISSSRMPPVPDEPPATARSETRQPYPMMMTLITTTTTTTIAPPPPDWVRSVEESFRTGQRLNSGEASASSGGDSDGWRPLSTLGTQKPPLVHSGEQIGVGHTGPPSKPLPIRPEKGDGDGGSRSREGEDDENDGGKKEEGGGGEDERRNGGGGEQEGPVAVYGVIELPPGAAISIREKTKVTRLVEKTKYIGPCGSACTYGDQLVRLYRSFNSNPQVSDHFYTTERLEQHLMASQGFLMEPSMGFVGRNQVDPNCSCIRPLYRLYSAFAKDHFLTSNDQEKGVAETLLGYVFERILGYCTREPGCGAYLPLYRFYNAISKDHFYTVDQQEMHYYKTHTELAYGFEKIECYVWQHSSSAKGCPALALDVDERRREDREEWGLRSDGRVLV